MAAILTTEIKHYTVWHYANDQYRDTEPWLYRYTIYRAWGIRIWTRRIRKVYLPIWSWAANAFNGTPKQYYSAFGGDPVSYNWDTGEVTPKKSGPVIK